MKDDKMNIDMNFLFGLAAAPIFWPIFIVVIGAFWTCVVCEAGYYSTVFLAFVIAASLLKFPFVLDFITVANVLISIPVFLVIGLVWARFKWGRLVSMTFDKVIERRKSFLASHGLTDDFFVNFDEKQKQDEIETAAKLKNIIADKTRNERERTVDCNIVVNNSLKGIFEKYVEFMSGMCDSTWKVSTYENLVKELTPKAIKNKAAIVMWIAYWPISMVWYIIGDLLKDLGLALYKLVGGNFQKVANSKFEQL